MNKLKTLKDIDIYGDQLISEQELRKEAIKWVKAMQSEDKIVTIKNNKGENLHWVASDCLDNYTIDWIKHFFNLTTEELK